MNVSFSRLVVLLAVLFLPPLASSDDSLEAVEKSASDWVKLRLETTRLETDWRSERELVASLATALKERAAAMEEKRDLVKAKGAKDREELAALRAKNEAAREDLQVVETRLKALTEKLVALRPNLPPRLSDALEMSYRSLGAPELPAGERMQLVMTMLNRCAQFQRIITVGEDVLTLGGEPAAKSFEVIYWGLSHGYALDRVARKAWLGFPGPAGWAWEPRPDAFDSVLRLVAIASDKADPDFVAVPAVGARSVTETSNP